MAIELIDIGTPYHWGANDEWREHAACRNIDTNLFFPIGVTGVAIEQIEAAKAICLGCSVQEECLRFALTTNQDSGVWGGASEEERRTMRRSWRRRMRQQRQAS